MKKANRGATKPIRTVPMDIGIRKRPRPNRAVPMGIRIRERPAPPNRTVPMDIGIRERSGLGSRQPLPYPDVRREGPDQGGGGAAAKGQIRRGHLLTEQRNPRSWELDALSIEAAFDLMNAEDAGVPAAVARAKRGIVEAIRRVSAAWQCGGRLIYIGAGTSGRLGVLDAAECPPTFRSDPKMVRGVIAGGRKALWRSVEGAEDEPAAARAALRELRVNRRDVVLGIASGGTTPYVHAALAEARRRGATTIFLACVPRSQVRAACDVDVRILTGPEILTGSTRLKAGTATKLVLNMITTLSMVRIGKTFGHLMVDLNTYACRKLVDRATRVVSTVTGLPYAAAGRLLHAARGRVKTAIVMHMLGVTLARAEALLKKRGGRVRDTLLARGDGV